jgi:hypothetical protein
MSDPRIPNYEQCLQVLRQTPGLLRGVMNMATPAQLDWRPPADRWSISMVLAHLAEVETRGFQSRFTAMLSSPDAVLPAYDQMAQFRARTEFDPHAEIARFQAARADTLAMLEHLPDGAGERSGRHEELGPITVAQLLNEFAFHDLGHVRQVMELYRSQVFFPEMGVYQGYYKINP